MLHLKMNVSAEVVAPMSRLIDATKLEQEVKKYIPEFNITHHTYLETISMLVKEIEDCKAQEAYLLARLRKAENHE